MTAEVLFKDLTPWERALLGYVFLNRADAILEFCEAHIGERVRACLTEVRSLPRGWGAELCKGFLEE